MPLTPPPDTIAYGSSLRAAPVEAHTAKGGGMGCPVWHNACYDTTQLDRIGNPGLRQHRPGAQRGSLCVSAVKGWTLAEARIGAYMEALGLALAEWGVAPLEVVMATPERCWTEKRAEAILDFCPNLDGKDSLDEPLACVRQRIFLRGNLLVPRNSFFLLRLPTLSPGDTLAQQHRACLGNTLLEATVHGPCRVHRADVTSFSTCGIPLSLFPNETLPPQAKRWRSVGRKPI